MTAQPKNKLRLLICPDCGAEFEAVHGNRKFCTEACRHSFSHKHKTQEQKERRQVKQKRWRNKTYNQRRAYMLKYNYGITAEQYEALLQKQNGCCAVCERHYTEFARQLAVDHDHHTHEIRGLLCDHCNYKIIGRNRSPEIFLGAGRYLSGPYTGWFVPKKKPKKRKRRARKSIRRKVSR